MTPEQLANHQAARARQLAFNNSRAQPTPRRKNKSAGVGGRFAAIARKLGYRGCAGCDQLARRMDQWGPDECRHREDYILDEIERRAKQKRLFFTRAGARVALRFAIASTPIADVAIEGELKAWQDGQT